MANLVLSALSAYTTYAKANFIRKTYHPEAAQTHFLKTLLRHHQDTLLGREFGLQDITTVEQFRQKVPIWDYSDYEPYTDRIAQGEPNVLSPDPVVYINLTSGSTGKQKMVPVTRRFQASLQRATLACTGFAIEALRRRSVGRPYPLEFGKVMIANSARLQGRTSAGIPYGPVTAGGLQRDKLLSQNLFAQPYKIAQVQDTASRHYLALLFALCNPGTRGMAANFPMLVLRICHYLEQYGESLIQDMERGTIADWLTLEPDIRSVLERQWSAFPQRAAELRQLLRTEGRLTPKAAWPRLAFVLTAFGGTSQFYFERFPEFFGDLPVFGGVFGTAEGNFSVYHDFDVEGGILALDSGFYEFVPEDQWQVAQPQTVMPTEVEVGRRYRILVTSYSGFYRYDIGDVIEVVGFYNQTPLIVFRHRRGGLLSSTTEKTTEFHATQTMQALQQEFNLHLEDFCITLSEREIPAHYWVNIELAADQQLNQPKQFLRRFDEWLGEFNRPYRTVRSSEVPPPRLRILAPGSFAIVRQRQLLRGTSDSQLKIPHINEDRQFLDGLTVLEEHNMQENLSSLSS